MAFEMSFRVVGKTVRVELSGELDASSVCKVEELMAMATTSAPKRLVLVMRELRYAASDGLRVLVSARKKMGKEAEILLVGAQAGVLRNLVLTGTHRNVLLLESAPGQESLSSDVSLAARRLS